MRPGTLWATQNMEHEIDSTHGSGHRRAQGLLGTGDKEEHTDFENTDYEPWNTENIGHGNMRQRTVQNARLGVHRKRGHVPPSCTVMWGTVTGHGAIGPGKLDLCPQRAQAVECGM